MLAAAQVYPAGTPMYVKDVLMLRLILENWDKRPIYYSLTAGNSNWIELDEYLTCLPKTGPSVVLE